MRVVAHDMPPIVRASWLRGVSALPNTFAHESYIDELATEAGVDPIEYRLRYLKDPRAVDLVNAVAERAGWTPRPVRQEPVAEGDIVRGRGFAYALYVHSKFPGYGAAWSAWIADVAVNKATGDVSVTRVVAGQDSGLMINPDGVRHQIHGNVIQSTSRALMEEVSFDRSAVTSREWGAYPIIKFPEIPKIDVLMLPRQDQPPLGVGESASVPSAAAIANAIFDATGVRFRELPFTPERILAGLRGEAARCAGRVAARGTDPLAPPTAWQNPFARRRGVFAGDRGVVRGGDRHRRRRAAVAGDRADRAAGCVGLFGRDHRARPATCRARRLRGLPHQRQRRRQCRRPCRSRRRSAPSTAPTSRPIAETGIGAWSYPAFERAMREGIHRDGRQLYPAFPYTHFAKTTDADLQALYAYLMAQPPVHAEIAQNKARRFRSICARCWPDGTRCSISPAPFEADATQSASWNRGAYLVEGLGHCSACHSPRNALGAEKAEAYLAGGFAEGWEAPPLTSLSHAPIPWSEDELFAYLRTGESRFHGVAAGPMAPVVKELASLPDQDIRAMAVYLGSFNEQADRQTGPGRAGGQARKYRPAHGSLCGLVRRRPALSRRLRGLPRSRRRAAVRQPASLALNSNLHSAMPDNLVQVILHGIASPAIERSRLHAGLQGQHERRPARRAGVLSAAAIRPGQAGHGPTCARPSAGSDRPAQVDSVAQSNIA